MSISGLASPRRSFRAYAPVLLSVAIGFVLSPAFTVGTLVKSRKSAILGSLLVCALAFLEWKLFWFDYIWHPSANEYFTAVHGRLGHASALSAIMHVTVHICCLIAGGVARHFFDRYRPDLVPLLPLVAAAFLVQASLSVSAHVDENLARVEGNESGRVALYVASREAAEAITSEPGLTGREKLLLLYMDRRTVARGAGVTPKLTSFESFLAKIARSCEDDGMRDDHCSNPALEGYLSPRDGS